MNPATASSVALPTLTVVMPVYNAAPWLAAAIGSVLQQSYPHFAFIIVDDGSTDSSLAIAQRFAQHDARIVLLRALHEGAGAARNLAIHAAQSDWIVQCDADDCMHPERLARLLAFIAQHPAISVTSCFGRYIAPNGRYVGRLTHDLITAEKFDWYMSNNEAIGIMCSGAAFKRTAFLAVGGYREHVFPAEDIDLWNRLSEAGYRIWVQPEFLMDIAIHLQSTLGRDFLATRLKYEWVRSMMSARRQQRSEPSWEQFLAIWHAAPWTTRLNRKRKILAKRCFRHAGLDWATGHRTTALFNIVVALLLQPSYATQRLWQRIPRLGRETS